MDSKIYHQCGHHAKWNIDLIKRKLWKWVNF